MPEEAHGICGSAICGSHYSRDPPNVLLQGLEPVRKQILAHVAAHLFAVIDGFGEMKARVNTRDAILACRVAKAPVAARDAGQGCAGHGERIVVFIRVFGPGWRARTGAEYADQNRRGSAARSTVGGRIFGRRRG
jgi:hypothetical protein